MRAHQNVTPGALYLWLAALSLTASMADANTCPGGATNPNPMFFAQGEQCEFQQQCVYYAVNPPVNCRCNASMLTKGTFVCNYLDSPGFSPTAPAPSPPIQVSITSDPTSSPTAAPTTPAPQPTFRETPQPPSAFTASPTVKATPSPTAGPTISPTAGPTVSPTAGPTVSPTISPTVGPTKNPTPSPTADPSCSAYSACATLSGACCPNEMGMFLECCSGVVPITPDPTPTPTVSPTEAPVAPTEAPVAPTEAPVAPTEAPVAPTEAPVAPTEAPVVAATPVPTAAEVEEEEPADEEPERKEPTEAPVEPVEVTEAPADMDLAFANQVSSGRSNNAAIGFGLAVASLIGGALLL